MGKKQFTAKHYEVDLYASEWTPQKIIKTIKKWGIIDKYAFILHDQDEKDGKPLKPHYHVYVSFGQTSTTIQSTANHFGIDPKYVERIKKDRVATLKYFLHIDEPEKHPYDISEMTANFDVLAEITHQNQQRLLKTILEECTDGTITRANLTERIPKLIYVKYRTLIENALHFADLKYLSSMADVDVPVKWVYGPSNTGKTTLCKLASKQMGLDYFVTANGNDPFSEYHDQASVIIDELRPHEQFSFLDLLHILDPHTVAATHSRYHDKILKAKVIWITTLYSPEEYYRALYISKKESAIQLYRRLQEVWHVEEQTVTISRFDTKTELFVETGSTSNPVPGYLATKAPVQKTSVDSIALLGDIEKQYQTAAPAVLALPPASAEGEAAADTEAENLPFPDASEQENEMENLSMFDEAV